jgi:Cys-tRNA(Pro)/Cys-tRNA(Cys) deacylase
MGTAGGRGHAGKGTHGGTPATVALGRAGIEHRIHVFGPHDDDGLGYGRAAAAALGVDEARVFKTLLVEVDGRPGVAVVPVSRKLSLKAVAAALGGKRAEMLDPANAQRITGYVVGGISPFGQKRLLPTVVDASCEGWATIFVSAGKRGMDLEVAPGDLLRVLGARTAAIAMD